MLPFSVHHIKRHIMPICPIIGDAKFSHIKFAFPFVFNKLSVRWSF